MNSETSTVGDHMTSNPVTIPADLSLADAAQRMHDHGIRHLPVIDQGHVVGIVSERDLALVMGIPGVDKERVEVTEAMRAHPYIVEPSTPLVQVVTLMHERKLGTAVVMEKGELRGIFSVIDALEALLIMLQGR
ncbi:CBS domain-containing protein [Enhygromyxa salina]|uniref:Inosine 5'-monophosphate dehydrogenase n=1 Tax=Enhygromyxa salina TaxID=215803 RepID=A0A2S9XTI9_9BACT|nr:CBS domain-containing protein [Enhygromyxa salina]PRP96175.1 inosine 5'-monophosphate dehydrogenase [Enhygromyxa salina]